MALIRALLLGDTHLGFDLPERPRVSRRRRGHDFFANFERALAPALRGQVDLVVHGGDLLYRSRVPPGLVVRALEPLRRVAAAGVPVFFVPGNHERSRLPYPILAAQRGLHVFARPACVTVQIRGVTVAVGGFPYERHDVRRRFVELVGATGLLEARADVRLLCVHHCVEGAAVRAGLGPADHVFRAAPDVIRTRDLPVECAAVFSGHIHRAQVLTTDLARRPLPTPVLYPGSVERTSFAERDEPKGSLWVDLEPGPTGGRVAGFRFVPLPTRPMILKDVEIRSPSDLESQVRAAVASVPSDAVLRLRLHGPGAGLVSTRRLRELAPPTMNIEMRPMVVTAPALRRR